MMSTKSKQKVTVNTSKLRAGKNKQPPTSTNDNLNDKDPAPIDAASTTLAAEAADTGTTAQTTTRTQKTANTKKTEEKATAEFVAPKSMMDDFDLLAVTKFGFKRGSKSKMFIELVNHYKNNPPA